MADIIYNKDINYDANTFYVDVYGKIRIKTYKCGSYKEAVAKAEEYQYKPLTNFIYVWN